MGIFNSHNVFFYNFVTIEVLFARRRKSGIGKRKDAAISVGRVDVGE